MDRVLISMTIDLGTSGIKLIAPFKKASAEREDAKGVTLGIFG